MPCELSDVGRIYPAACVNRSPLSAGPLAVLHPLEGLLRGPGVHPIPPVHPPAPASSDAPATAARRPGRLLRARTRPRFHASSILNGLYCRPSRLKTWAAVASRHGRSNKLAKPLGSGSAWAPTWSASPERQPTSPSRTALLEGRSVINATPRHAMPRHAMLSHPMPSAGADSVCTRYNCATGSTLRDRKRLHVMALIHTALARALRRRFGQSQG